MLQGTDSGFCDSRYHPSYYSEDPQDETAWLGESSRQRKDYIAQAELTWKTDTDGPCIEK